MTTVITREIATKVLEIVDAGLVKGVGNPVAGQMCVEAAVCFALGLPHGDDPKCVSPALRALKITLNDAAWSSNAARAKGLRRLAVIQLGSLGVLDDRDFVRRVAEMTVRKIVPVALRAAAVLRGGEHAVRLHAAADRCETEGTYAAAAADADDAATYAAATYAATYAADAADAADADADAATYAATYAAAEAARAAAYAAAYAARAAADAAAAAARAATYAADAADAATYAAAVDETLLMFAENVVQVLIEMKAPGCEWLALTEVN